MAKVCDNSVIFLPFFCGYVVLSQYLLLISIHFTILISCSVRANFAIHWQFRKYTTERKKLCDSSRWHCIAHYSAPSARDLRCSQSACRYWDRLFLQILNVLVDESMVLMMSLDVLYSNRSIDVWLIVWLTTSHFLTPVTRLVALSALCLPV